MKSNTYDLPTCWKMQAFRDRAGITFTDLVGKIDSSHLRFFLAGIYGYETSEKSSRSEPFFSSITVKVIPVRSLRYRVGRGSQCVIILQSTMLHNLQISLR